MKERREGLTIDSQCIQIGRAREKEGERQSKVNDRDKSFFWEIKKMLSANTLQSSTYRQHIHIYCTHKYQYTHTSHTHRHRHLTHTHTHTHWLRAVQLHLLH